MEFNVVGIQRSGTFYSMKLIEYNFNVMSHIGVEQESFSKHDHRQHEVSVIEEITIKTYSTNINNDKNN